MLDFLLCTRETQLTTAAALRRPQTKRTLVRPEYVTLGGPLRSPSELCAVVGEWGTDLMGEEAGSDMKSQKIG